MSKLKIVGGKELNGEIEITAAKNTLLPILAGCILVDGIVEITNYVEYTDCIAMENILKSLGARIEKNEKSLFVDCREIKEWTITTDLAQEVRSSFFTLGALIGRVRLAKVAYPGGCNIGTRPVNIHLKGLRDIGISIIERHGYIYCNAGNINGGNIHLEFPSVGATENIMMAACTINGTTILTNCAKEPEIMDLQNFLNSCGAQIEGAGSDKIIIKGIGKLLHGTKYRCISDRIIAGTYAIATACARGDVYLKNVDSEMFVTFFNRLGKIDLPNQNEIIGSLKKQLEVKINGEIKEEKNKGVMFFKVFIVLGFVVGILCL